MNQPTDVLPPPPHGVLTLLDTQERPANFPDRLVSTTLRGRYRLDDVHTRKADSAVFLAKKLGSERRVLLEILGPDAADEGRRDFARAASFGSTVDHEVLARVLDRGETEDGLPFIVWEHVDGVSVQELVGKVDAAGAVRIAAQALEGLRYLHSKQITHANLCPATLLVTRASDGLGQVKILDLSSAVTGTDAAPLTMSSLMTGTPGYVAPEQIGGKDFDHRVDLYALGVVFYELLTGKPAWPTSDPGRILELQLSHSLPPLSAEHVNYENFLHRLVTRDPTDRFATAEVALEALEEALLGRERRSSEEISRKVATLHRDARDALATEAGSKSSRRWLIPALGVACAVAAAAVLVMPGDKPSAGEPAIKAEAVASALNRETEAEARPRGPERPASSAAPEEDPRPVPAADPVEETSPSLAPEPDDEVVPATVTPTPAVDKRSARRSRNKSRRREAGTPSAPAASTQSGTNDSAAAPDTADAKPLDPAADSLPDTPPPAPPSAAAPANDEQAAKPDGLLQPARTRRPTSDSVLLK